MSTTPAGVGGVDEVEAATPTATPTPTSAPAASPATMIPEPRGAKASFERLFGGKQQAMGMAVLAVLVFVVFPALMDPFRLNMIGKYLTYAFVALGLVLCWGHGGILSLGQGVFFGLGGYCMAMFLKLEASDPVSTAIQSTPGIPDFMDWNQITQLPLFWRPFHSLGFTLLAVIGVPCLLALLIGTAMFKRRVGGVYFAIITQAIAAILSILIIGRQGWTGGVNGITDLKTLHGWDLRTDSAHRILYFINALLLFAAIGVCRWILGTKLGRLMVAMRDKEERVRFSGYDVANVKVFVFVMAAGLAAVGGAMFSLQVGFMSPSFVGIVPSIEMVVFAAVGGRESLLGVVYGTLVVNWSKTYFSEKFPQLWLVLMGALFIGVVKVFPRGLAGLYESHGRAFIAGTRERLGRVLSSGPRIAPAPTPVERHDP